MQQLMYHRDHSEYLLIDGEQFEFDVFSNNGSASCIDLGLVLVRSLIDESFFSASIEAIAIEAEHPCHACTRKYDAQKPHIERGGT